MKPRDVVRAGMARTFQNTQLFDAMTARENVMVGAQAHQRQGFAAVGVPVAVGACRGARRIRRGRAGSCG